MNIDVAREIPRLSNEILELMKQHRNVIRITLDLSNGNGEVQCVDNVAAGFGTDLFIEERYSPDDVPDESYPYELVTIVDGVRFFDLFTAEEIIQYGHTDLQIVPWKPEPIIEEEEDEFPF